MGRWPCALVSVLTCSLFKPRSVNGRTTNHHISLPYCSGIVLLNLRWGGGGVINGSRPNAKSLVGSSPNKFADRWFKIYNLSFHRLSKIGYFRRPLCATEILLCFTI